MSSSRKWTSRARARKRPKAGQSKCRVGTLKKSRTGTRWPGSWREVEGAVFVAMRRTAFVANFKSNAKGN